MTDDTELIQRFVNCFARLDDSTFSHADPPPPEFAAGIDPDDWNAIRWRPLAMSSPIESLGAIRRVGVLPNLYEQLATSYRWPDIDIGICRLLPNLLADDLRPLSDSMFADPVLNATLIPNGFARFALAPNGCYDPICFDLNRFANDNACSRCPYLQTPTHHARRECRIDWARRRAGVRSHGLLRPFVALPRVGHRCTAAVSWHNKARD